MNVNRQRVLRRSVLAARCAARPGGQLFIRRYATEEETEESAPLTEYPKVPDVSRQYLPPTGWHDNLMRRNFGDALHEREELHSMWAPDVPPISPYTALRHFLIAAGGIVSAGLVIKIFLVPEPPVVRRQYPFDGLVKELGGVKENKARVLALDTDE